LSHCSEGMRWWWRWWNTFQSSSSCRWWRWRNVFQSSRCWWRWWSTFQGSRSNSRRRRRWCSSPHSSSSRRRRWCISHSSSCRRRCCSSRRHCRFKTIFQESIEIGINWRAFVMMRSNCCTRRRSLLCGDIRVDDGRLEWRWTWSLVLFVNRESTLLLRGPVHLCRWRCDEDHKASCCHRWWW
jgi:hypothetical protein